MPDITMCDDGCGRKYDCYRYMAKPDKWQSYALFRDNMRIAGKRSCGWFEKIAKGDAVRTMAQIKKVEEGRK